MAKPSKSASPSEIKRRVAAFVDTYNTSSGGHDDWIDPFEDAFTPPRKRSKGERVKPGRKPRGNWPTLIEQWLLQRKADYPQQGENIDALVVEAKIFLRDRIKWAPKDNKDLRARIREQLRRDHR
jgi:hypothetical protein